MLTFGFAVVICAGICASLVVQGVELGRIRMALEGDASAAPERVRALLSEARSGGETEQVQARLELASLLKMRASMLRRVPKVLGRAALLVGASTGFIELASGLPRGAEPWLGVACLGLGLFTQAFISGLGRRLEKRAEALVSRVKLKSELETRNN